MNMTILAIKSIIEARIKETSDFRGRLLKTIDKEPEGNIYVKKNHGKNLYFSKSSTDELNGRYLGQSRIDEIQQLERKNYVKCLKKASEDEIETLKKVKTLLDSVLDFSQVFEQIPEEKRHLISPFTFEKTEKEIIGWRNDRKTIMSFPKNTKYVTTNGIQVRSKSELIIAERLEKFGIPYRYEYPIVIGKELWSPDFLVLNRKTGKEYLWEHFGMLDNPEYCEQAQGKIEMYAENGIIQGENLIITTESSGHFLNTDYIDRIINKFLK